MAADDDILTKLKQLDFRQKLTYNPTTLFGTKMKGQVGLGAPFAVNYDDPNSIRYDMGKAGFPKSGPITAPEYAMGHEVEHVLDMRASARYGKGFSKERAFTQAYNDAGGKGHPISALRGILDSKEVQKRLEELKLDDGYTSEIRKAPLDELLASLSGYETAKGVDLTQDPVLKKTLFSDPALLQAYKATTGLRTERLDAKDLAPYTVQTPFYKDPFGDTTK